MRSEASSFIGLNCTFFRLADTADDDHGPNPNFACLLTCHCTAHVLYTIHGKHLNAM